jgi:hypothetical protein
VRQILLQNGTSKNEALVGDRMFYTDSVSPEAKWLSLGNANAFAVVAQPVTFTF